MTRKPVIHLRGNPPKAGIECGAPEKRSKYTMTGWNWAFAHQNVTCRRCLAIHRKRVKENQ